MNKGVVIPVISVLAIGIVVTGYLLWQQTGKLGEAGSEIVALEGNVSDLQAKLVASEAKASSLEADLKTANAEIEKAQADVKTQQSINSALSAELKKVEDPRHFESLSELTDWLQKDDTNTNTKYADVSNTQRAFILQVKALRDGYLLPVSLYTEGVNNYVGNRAVIGDIIYGVRAGDDYTWRYSSTAPLPSHPLPLD